MNLGHIAEHAVTAFEAEYLVEHPARGKFVRVGDRYRVRGQTITGRYLQVVFVFNPETVVYVIHARDLTENEKRQVRKRRK